MSFENFLGVHVPEPHIQIEIQIHKFIADIKVYIQYTIKIFKLKCYNDFTLYLNTNHNQLTIIK